MEVFPSHYCGTPSAPYPGPLFKCLLCYIVIAAALADGKQTLAESDLDPDLELQHLHFTLGMGTLVVI